MSFISHSIREVIREMLQGQLVRLRAFESGDLETNHLFVNDEETALLMYKGMPFPTSLNDEQQWLSQQSSYTRGEYQFAVENMDGDLVGRCGIVRLLLHIDADRGVVFADCFGDFGSCRPGE